MFHQHSSILKAYEFFAGKARAVKDIWIVGDHLIRDAYPALQNLQAAARHGEQCYLQDMYDTYGYYPDFTETNPIAMIRNTVIAGLNAHLKMPNAIIVLCGTDLITQDPVFLPSELEKKVRWVLREVMAAISTRKSLLLPKNFTYGEPRLIWIKSFQTTVGDPVPPAYINKFNNLLYRACAGKAVYAPDLEMFVTSGSKCYDECKRIIEKSFKDLWLAISDCVKKIDERDEQYFISRKVEERLKELRHEDELRFERKASTFLAVTDSKSFTEAASKNQSVRRLPPPPSKRSYAEDRSHRRSAERDRHRGRRHYSRNEYQSSRHYHR